MASNNTVSNNVTTEDYSTSISPVWTVPIDSTLTSDKSVLPFNTNLELQTYDTFISQSASDIDDLPPNYFDVSIVPNGAVLFHNDVPPYTEASKAEIERNRKGVLSFDQLIDKNPDQLWLYFMTYLNEKPKLDVNIRGYYIEYYTERESYRHTKGNWQTRTITKSRIVTEFYFSIDLSPYICEHWWRVAVIPSAKAKVAGETVTLRDALEQYTLSNKKIKEIILQKQLHGWNQEELKNKLIALVRSTGYQNNISVTYHAFNYQIVARSSSKLSRFANSTVARVLCCISCLCLIFGPIYYCLRSIGSTRDNIIAEYMTMKPVGTFLRLNAQMIIDAVIQRSHKSYIARFA
ncbi:unnamed protein product [Adineta steineri]|uniref:Uncharacterized protein n=1 Tax=Adineta steineri TaxID=433720 RepID=A0A814RQU8_9BILA|nr:unnamed protein product [Adineta steineri]CAF1284274.1 unnamed protein product [Adineta steineri]